MKIAIYGDSHASMFLDISINSDKSWPLLLIEKYNYNVSNFGRGGSSLFYSYDQFMQTHFNYDKVIFFVTNPHRIYLSNEFLKDDNHLRFITGYSMADWYSMQYHDNPLYKKIFESVKDYYTYVENRHESQEFHNMMIEKIKLVRPDIIMIINNEFCANNDSDLIHYQKDPIEVYSKYFDLRHCHFSQEKHTIIAEILNEALKNNQSSINYEILKTVKPTKTFDQCFTPMSDPTFPIIMASWQEHLRQHAEQ